MPQGRNTDESCRLPSRLPLRLTFFEAQYDVAEIYFRFGELSERLASNVLRPHEQRSKDWQDAKTWYQRSLDIWRQIHNPGAVIPLGFTCGNAKSITAAIAKCETALSSLNSSSTKVKN
jgi:hypothetical protein